jgi:P-type Ca2+ transporter type 2C
MWFTKSTEQVIAEIGVDPSKGLSDEEVKIRLEKYGANRLLAKKKKSLLQLLLAQLQDWLIYILFAAVVITLFLGEYVDAVIIILVICTNAVLGVIQEVKAEKAIEALQQVSFPKALVLRSGEPKMVDSHRVVPGDILILDSGRAIAADIRIIESANLRVEESALTGESLPSKKDALLVFDNPKTPLGDRANIAFMSTHVTSGRGVGVVVETGMNTEIGKIAQIINTEVKTKTPLEIRLGKLGKTIGKGALAICVLIFLLTLIQGRDIGEMFLLSVSLAVAAIPEGLAAIVAVVLSIGVTRMSKKNAIIKKLPAVETLGSVNIICSDKTGTLTQNVMTVTSYYNLDGKIKIDRNVENTATEDVELLVKAMVLCSDATYKKGHRSGDPTEIALLILGDDIGMNRAVLNAENKRVGEFSFDSDRKLMSTINELNGEFTVYTKGAIGNLLNICTHVREKGQVIKMTGEHKTQYLAAAKNMADHALRTLGAACKPTSSILEPEKMEKDLIFLGFVGMIDPPRPEVKASILTAKLAGIRTIMITGDHKNTAYAIAHELGISQHIGEAITGEEMDEFTDKEFDKQVTNYVVFARVSPEHKVKIVHALQSHHNIVSMTGDGVNDAPSLHAADIGVAMGITGTDVAKGAADMILTDDNFATIVTAIEQGRNIYNNIKKSVVFLLSCNLGEVIAVFITLLLGWSAPLIATQLLWINLVTDSFPAIALGMDPGNPDVMKEKPRNSTESFFANGSALHIILGGILIGGLTIAAFWFGYYEHGFRPSDNAVPETVVEYARTMAFLVLVMCQLFYSLAVRDSIKSIFSIGLFSNKYLTGAIVLGMLLQLAVIGIPFMQRAFHLQMPDLKAWIMAIILGLIPLTFSEIFKLFKRHNIRAAGK